MAKLTRSFRFTGVYFRESAKRKHRGKPDRIYWIAFPGPDTKTRWQRIGAASQGVTEQYAAQQREQMITGAMPIPVTEGRLTVADAVRSYAAWRKAERKDISRDLELYNARMADRLGALPIHSITPGMLTEHKARLRDEGMGSQRIFHAFSFLRAAVYHAEGNGEYRGSNPFRSSKSGRFRLEKPKNNRFRWFTEAEAEHILCGLQGSMVRDMSLLSLHTGMRATEIFSLRADGIETDAGLLWFTAKSGALESVPAESWLIELLQENARRGGDFVFAAKHGGRLRWGIPNAWTRCLNDLGINDGVERCMRATFHTWRHTFASWLAQSGDVTLHELREIMRHRRIETTLRYAHLIPGHQRRASSIISSRLGEDLSGQTQGESASGHPQLRLVPPKKSA